MSIHLNLTTLSDNRLNSKKSQKKANLLFVLIYFL